MHAYAGERAQCIITLTRHDVSVIMRHRRGGADMCMLSEDGPTTIGAAAVSAVAHSASIVQPAGGGAVARPRTALWHCSPMFFDP